MDGLAKLGLPNSFIDLQTARAKSVDFANKTAAAKAADANAQDLKKMREQAEEFEQIFLQNMLSTMMEGTTPSAPFNGGAGEDQWKGFLTSEYAGALARNGGIGLADSIYRDLVALQETPSTPKISEAPSITEEPTS